MLFGTLLFGIVLLVLAVWRLSLGPVELDFLTGRLEAALNTDGAPTHIEIGGIILAWEGFHQGLDRPVDRVPLPADAAVTGMIRQPNIDSAAQS